MAKAVKNRTMAKAVKNRLSMVLGRWDGYTLKFGWRRQDGCED